MAKQEAVKKKVTASLGYEYIAGKRTQIKKTETVLVPVSVMNSQKKFNAFIDRERERIRKNLEVERQTAKSDLTFREYAKKVAARKRGDGDVRIITEQSNNSIMEYVNTIVGDYKMKDIDKDTVHMVKEAINNKPSARGGTISDKTKYNYFCYFRSVINSAADDNYYKENPLSKVRNFSFEDPEPTYLDKDEIQDIITKMAQYHIKRIVEVLLFLLTGTRRGEGIGFRWEDLQYDKKEEIHYFDLKEGYYQAPEVGPFRGELKTKKSKGKVPVHDELHALLMEYKEWQDKQAEILGDRWKGTGYIITRDDGGNYHPDTVSKRVKATLKKLGYGDMTIYSLRRSFATLATEENVATARVSNLLRHADIKITDRYIDPARKQLGDVSFLDSVLPQKDAKSETKTPKKPFKRLGKKEYVR